MRPLLGHFLTFGFFLVLAAFATRPLVFYEIVR
jgi:hypothetical protein